MLERGMADMTAEPVTARPGAVVEDWYPAARRVLSPNYNARPVLSDISLLVIHNISLPPGQFDGDAIERFFCNQLPADEHPYYAGIAHLTVSAHVLIRRDGEVIQFVPFSQRAWHAGASCHAGRENCNDFSIGIELEGADDLPYTDAQYARLVDLTHFLMAAFPQIQAERIVGHEHIAPERKTDPGPAFDWARYLGSLSVLAPTV